MQLYCRLAHDGGVVLLAVDLPMMGHGVVLLTVDLPVMVLAVDLLMLVVLCYWL